MSKTKPVDAKHLRQAKTALFMRVSTERQKHDRQKTILSDWAKSQRLRQGQYAWYREKVSGSKETASRTGLSKLLRDVDAGRVHSVVIDRLDRLSRSTRKGLELLALLADQGCRVVAVQQQIDWNGSMGKFLATLFLALGEWEREQTRDRIIEGMAAARSNGKHCGRPRNQKRYEQVAKMRASGMSVQQISERLGIKRQSTYYLLSQAGTTQDKSE